LTDSKDPRKYWTVIKSRLKNTNSQLTTKCSQFKLIAEDGKKRLTDCLVQDDVLSLADDVPSKKTRAFIE